MMMKKILLGMIALSAIMMADLSRNSSGVVTDSTRGLEWQDDYSGNNGSIKEAKWQDAIDYCEALTLDGGRWRLPNIRELNSIADLSHVNPAIDPVFQHTATDYYWSSSTTGATLTTRGTSTSTTAAAAPTIRTTALTSGVSAQESSLSPRERGLWSVFRVGRNR